MNHQNDNKLYGLKVNDANVNHQNNERIGKHKVNDDELNDEYDRDREKCKG